MRKTTHKTDGVYTEQGKGCKILIKEVVLRSSNIFSKGYAFILGSALLASKNNKMRHKLLLFFINAGVLHHWTKRKQDDEQKWACVPIEWSDDINDLGHPLTVIWQILSNQRKKKIYWVYQNLLSRGLAPQLLFYPYVSKKICPSSEVSCIKVDTAFFSTTNTGRMWLVTCLICLVVALYFKFCVQLPVDSKWAKLADRYITTMTLPCYKSRGGGNTLYFPKTWG